MNIGYNISKIIFNRFMIHFEVAVTIDHRKLLQGRYTDLILSTWQSLKSNAEIKDLI